MKTTAGRQSLFVILGVGAIALGLLAEMPFAGLLFAALERQLIADPLLAAGASMSSGIAGMIATWRFRRLRNMQTHELQQRLKDTYREVVDRYLAGAKENA